MKQSKASPRTKAIHGQFSSKAWEFSHHIVPPMTASTSFRLESLRRGAQGFVEFGENRPDGDKPIWIYDRLEEPTTKMLEEQLAQMEGGECAISFASGMGAISTALMTSLKTGDHLLAHRTLYGCTYSLITNWLPRFGIDSTLMDLNHADFEKQLKNPKLRVIYFEAVTNPSLEIIDMERLAKLTQKINATRPADEKIRIIVDNTFATPWGLRPLEWGADIVIQSLTKNISGFGTEMGGAIVTRKEFDISLRVGRKDFGAIIHPYSAWHILVYGISTQALRFEEQQRTAGKVALYLEKHPKVECVIYPGLESHPQFALAKKYLKSPEGDFAPGTMISFQVKGDLSTCEHFVDDIAKNSYTITLAVSLGLTKTLIEVPGYMTHSAIPGDQQASSGIDPRGIRLSIGLEKADDIIRDLETALGKL